MTEDGRDGNHIVIIIIRSEAKLFSNNGVHYVFSVRPGVTK